MTKENLKSATDLLQKKQGVQNTLNDISKKAGHSFAHFDNKEVKFVSDSMEIMTNLANLLNNLGIKFTHKFEKLDSVPELVIAPEYVEIAHKLFDNWQSNIIIETNTRIANRNILVGKDR